jgi:hypothetical protein
MKFEIKNRFTGAVQVTAQIECGEDESYSIKLGLAVKWAVSAGANLARANLARADLAGANLAGANLAGALKIDPSEIPVIPNIDDTILAAIESGGVLDMSNWHGGGGWCGTTHCRAGWAIHLGGEKGKALQDKLGPNVAGTLIYEASRPGQPAPWFFDSTEGALSDLRKCAKEKRGESA